MITPQMIPRGVLRDILKFLGRYICIVAAIAGMATIAAELMHKCENGGITFHQSLCEKKNI